jgi:hypothetical protein
MFQSYWNAVSGPPIVPPKLIADLIDANRLLEGIALDVLHQREVERISDMIQPAGPGWDIV